MKLVGEFLYLIISFLGLLSFKIVKSEFSKKLEIKAKLIY